MRRIARVDINQPSLVDDLRNIGCTVQHLHQVGEGCPDIVVGFRGHNILMEIKNGKGKLTEDEHGWHREWRGQVAVVRNLDDAIEVLNLVTT